MNNITPINLPPQIFNQKGWIKLIDSEDLTALFDDTLEKSQFSVLNYNEHKFPLNGFTALWLLAESHLALHTFTESGWCYIELSSCNKSKAQRFSELLNNSSYEISWEDGLCEMKVDASLISNNIITT